MRYKTALMFILAGMISLTSLQAQEDLLAEMSKNDKPVIDYTTASFKTTRIVIGHSIELPPPGNLQFIITHHFGALNTGYENLFGLKQASIRLGLEYGLFPWMGFGAGLNTDKNTWDGFVQFKVLRQSKGARKMPVTLDIFANSAIYTTKWTVPERTNYFSSRISYACQVLVARKFGNALTLQIMPSYVHKNLVPTSDDHNDIFTLGAGGRVKISERVSVNAEYHHIFPGQVVSTKVYDSFSLGVDIETGGHVFQVFLTNSYGEYEETFLTDTRGKWSNGDIYLGFNINRMFTIIEPKAHKY
jgi:opacity protein-like surface antigen